MIPNENKFKILLGLIPEEAAVVNWTEVPVDPVVGTPFYNCEVLFMLWNLAFQ